MTVKKTKKNGGRFIIGKQEKQKKPQMEKIQKKTSGRLDFENPVETFR